jgi:hypothetical protein
MSILYRAVEHGANIVEPLAYADHLFVGEDLSAEHGKPLYKDETQ